MFLLKSKLLILFTSVIYVYSVNNKRQNAKLLAVVLPVKKM